jgi:flavin reductase (DIM6/NTAB) family NADH-FMN oxidoreductase RutF
MVAILGRWWSSDHDARAATMPWSTGIHRRTSGLSGGARPVPDRRHRDHDGLARQPVGVTASSFSSLSLDPPLVCGRSLCVAELFGLRRSEHFAVNILKPIRSTSQRFSTPPSDNSRTSSGSLVPRIAILPCPSAHRVRDGDRSWTAADHIILVGRVEALRALSATALYAKAGYAVAGAIRGCGGRRRRRALEASGGAGFARDGAPCLRGNVRIRTRSRYRQSSSTSPRADVFGSALADAVHGGIVRARSAAASSRTRCRLVDSTSWRRTTTPCVTDAGRACASRHDRACRAVRVRHLTDLRQDIAQRAECSSIL